MVNRPRRIGILLFDGVHLVDIAGPAEAFATASAVGTGYSLHYFSLGAQIIRASCGLLLTSCTSVEDLAGCDDLLVPGGNGIDRVMRQQEAVALVKNWIHGGEERRIISVCSGALLLAVAGVLDGQQATTHWRRSSDARHLGTRIAWNFDKIFTRTGNIFCSAGVTAGIDLALHIIEHDLGRDVALRVARDMVVPMQRSGGQSQHSTLLSARDLAGEQLRPLVEGVTARPQDGWTLHAMAELVGMSPRTLARHMKHQFSTSPMRFVELVRLDIASDLLANGSSIQAAARHAGFESVQRMNRAFKKHMATSAKKQQAFTSGPQRDQTS